MVGRSGLVDLGELLWVFDVGRSLCRLFGYYGSLAVSRLLRHMAGSCGWVAKGQLPWIDCCWLVVVSVGRCGLVAIGQSLCQSVGCLVALGGRCVGWSVISRSLWVGRCEPSAIG